MPRQGKTAVVTILFVELFLSAGAGVRFTARFVGGPDGRPPTERNE